MSTKGNKTEIFEKKPIWSALAIMAIPTIISQLIALVYNVADTWFIGQTDNPYMVAASSLVATVFLMTIVISNLFGVGGGSLVVRLLGSGEEEEAKKVASISVLMAGGCALCFSLLCLIFRDPLLYLLGASENTIGYARQYLFFVVIIGCAPTVLSSAMSAMLRNIGYAKEAAFGLGMGGVLNVILDPIFMFILLPDGYEVVGAAVATMLSNMTAFIYYVIIYCKVSKNTILAIPRKIEKVKQSSWKAIFAVGVPASINVLLYDFTNIIINKLSSSHGDLELAAMGIVLKIERLPTNIGIGICLGMMPLIAYNYAAKNEKRMKGFFNAARIAGITVGVICIVLYYTCAPYIMKAFISDPETVALGTVFLKARCFAPPFMFLSFNMVNFMQSIGNGKISFCLAVIRQLLLNIPILFTLNFIFGMTGIIWTQAIADCMNVIISYLIYFRVMKNLNMGSQV